ncbi:putative inorganic phosphate cotransporter isoform X2 [Periplaneta americana]
MLSAYYYGYVATQLLGGRLSEILGSKVVIGPGVLLAGLFTALSPLAARLHVAAFIAARVLIGAASGMIVPSSCEVLAKWFPVDERIFIGSLIMSGATFGAVISMVLSGILAEAGGWPLPYYLFGGISICFIVPWFLLMYDTPQEHPRISDKEKNYLLSSIGETTKKKHPVPWVAILTSVPLWMHIIIGVGYCFNFYMMLSELPTYLSNILHFDLQASGVLSSLPYIFNTLSQAIFGYISQWLVTKGYISKITAYRIFNGISAVGCAVCLVIITFMGCNSTVIVVLLIISVSMIGIYQGGSFISHVDLGNNFAGTTAGISYTMLNAMGIVSPSITGVLINGKQTLSQWAIVFYISGAIYLVTWILYMFFGSADEQPWNKLPSEDLPKTKEVV